MSLKLSCVYSIFNRTKLFERGLKTVDWQTMPKSDFELIVVDDNSTENVKKILRPYIGSINIRYIKYDRTKHPIWQELNPRGIEETWYHTQAISANIGINAAQGDIICISQPEMLHSPNSFAVGYERSMPAKQIFGEIHWATDRFNQWLEDHPKWYKMAYDDLLFEAQACGAEYTPNHMGDRDYYEMYWYVEYFPKAYAMSIGGVDLAYQAGVYAEDDQFKVRLRMAGCEERWGGRRLLDGSSDKFVVGIHQSHMDEKNKYKKQDRDSQFWNIGAERNRNLWRLFQANPYMHANQGLSYSCWGEFLITEDVYYGL